MSDDARRSRPAARSVDTTASAEVSPQDAAKATWATICRRAGAKADATPTAKTGAPNKGGPKPRLWEGDWNAKVIGIEGLPKLLPDQNAVVAVRTPEAQLETELWASSRSSNASTTVVLIGIGTDPVLFNTPRGRSLALLR